MNIGKNTKKLLCIALVLILLGSALAGLFNTGAGAGHRRRTYRRPSCARSS